MDCGVIGGREGVWKSKIGKVGWGMAGRRSMMSLWLLSKRNIIVGGITCTGCSVIIVKFGHSPQLSFQRKTQFLIMQGIQSAVLPLLVSRCIQTNSGSTVRSIPRAIASWVSEGGKGWGLKHHCEGSENIALWCSIVETHHDFLKYMKRCFRL